MNSPVKNLESILDVAFHGSTHAKTLRVALRHWSIVEAIFEQELKGVPKKQHPFLQCTTPITLEGCIDAVYAEHVRELCERFKAKKSLEEPTDAELLQYLLRTRIGEMANPNLFETRRVFHELFERRFRHVIPSLAATLKGWSPGPYSRLVQDHEVKLRQCVSDVMRNLGYVRPSGENQLL